MPIHYTKTSAKETRKRVFQSFFDNKFICYRKPWFQFTLISKNQNKKFFVSYSYFNCRTDVFDVFLRTKIWKFSFFQHFQRLYSPEYRKNSKKYLVCHSIGKGLAIFFYCVFVCWRKKFCWTFIRKQFEKRSYFGVPKVSQFEIFYRCL